MKKIDFKKYIPHLIILLASILISIPIFKMSLSSTNEFRIHIGRIVAISKLIKNNIFPALISNNNMNGFGYALNIFYGPITTYIPMLLSYKSIASTGIQLFTLISIIASGYIMYFYTLCSSIFRLYRKNKDKSSFCQVKLSFCKDFHSMS